MTDPQKSNAELQASLDKILALVESGHYASAFQSLGQYRTALTEFIKEVMK